MATEPVKKTETRIATGQSDAIKKLAQALGIKTEDRNCLGFSLEADANGVVFLQVSYMVLERRVEAAAELLEQSGIRDELKPA